VVCGDSASPQVTIQNNGNDTLKSVKVYYSLNGATPSLFNWSGSLSSQQTDVISLPKISGMSTGDHAFKVYTSDPNTFADQNNGNDTIVRSFKANSSPYFANMTLKTDDFGTETNWVVKEFSGDTYLEGGGYKNIPGGKTYNEQLCLYRGCFSLTINDFLNDGYCCGSGKGSLLLTDGVTGDTLKIDTTFNGANLVVNFCLPGNSIAEYDKGNFTLYPNPNNGQFQVDFVSSINENFTCEILDALGKRVFSKKDNNRQTIDIDLSNLNSGLYFIRLVSENINEAQRFIIR